MLYVGFWLCAECYLAHCAGNTVSPIWRTLALICWFASSTYGSDTSSSVLDEHWHTHLFLDSLSAGIYMLLSDADQTLSASLYHPTDTWIGRDHCAWNLTLDNGRTEGTIKSVLVLMEYRTLNIHSGLMFEMCLCGQQERDCKQPPACCCVISLWPKHIF